NLDAPGGRQVPRPRYDRFRNGDVALSTAFTAGERNWQARLGKLRDVMRQELVARQLAGELPPAPVRIIDLGCGQGTQALRLAAEDTAVACTGAALLAAAALHAQRGGDGGSRGSPTARLGRGHVAAAFRSEAYLRVNGDRTGPGFAPLSRFWRAADGWVRTHG